MIDFLGLGLILTTRGFEGDEMPADISYFENCDDQNVQTLIKQFKVIQYAIDYLMNTHSIQDDELGIKVTEI